MGEMGDWKFTGHCAKFSGPRKITCNSLMPKDFLGFLPMLGCLASGAECTILNSQQGRFPCYSNARCLLQFDVYPRRPLVPPKEQNQDSCRSMCNRFSTLPASGERSASFRQKKPSPIRVI